MTDAISTADAIASNRALWDAWTRVHRESAFYDVPGFLAGRDPLPGSWATSPGDAFSTSSATSASTPSAGRGAARG